MKLIDKDYLIQYLTGMANAECCDDNTERIIKKYIIPHINALELKEVDLEKELNIYLEKVKKTNEDIMFGDFAKHFFELGMKVSKKQKGE